MDKMDENLINELNKEFMGHYNLCISIQEFVKSKGFEPRDLFMSNLMSVILVALQNGDNLESVQESTSTLWAVLESLKKKDGTH